MGPLPAPFLHAFVAEPARDSTSAACTCGGWRREVGLDEVKLVGRSREEILRGAFAQHVAQFAPG